MDKSHIEHTICFVEDEYLDICESHVSLRDEIQQSPRSRDHDIDSLLHARDLLALTDSSEYDGRSELRMSTIRIETLLDLAREFTSRSEDEASSTSFCDEWLFPIFCDSAYRSFHSLLYSLRESLDDRECKGCRLPSTSLRTSEEVESSEYDGDGFLLYGSRVRISLFFESLEDRLYKLEFGEEHESRVL
jgi:hypothetical protein